METVHITNGDYETYEALVLQKEQLEKEAEEYYNEYIREFGELTTKAFELKIDCIALKKEIALHVAALNNGQKLTQEQIDNYMKAHMAAYNAQLQDMILKQKFAEGGKPISSFDAAQIKTLYRKLAKILHPDISPLAGKYPDLGELFSKVKNAYLRNSLKELQTLEVKVNSLLKVYGIESFNMVIPDIAERISELENEINDILNTEPYTYIKILSDDEATFAKKQALEDEIKEYTEYKEKLTKTLEELKAGENDE